MRPDVYAALLCGDPDPELVTALTHAALADPGATALRRLLLLEVDPDRLPAGARAALTAQTDPTGRTGGDPTVAAAGLLHQHSTAQLLAHPLLVASRDWPAGTSTRESRVLVALAVQARDPELLRALATHPVQEVALAAVYNRHLPLAHRATLLRQVLDQPQGLLGSAAGQAILDGATPEEVDALVRAVPDERVFWAVTKRTDLSAGTCEHLVTTWLAPAAGDAQRATPLVFTWLKRALEHLGAGVAEPVRERLWAAWRQAPLEPARLLQVAAVVPDMPLDALGVAAVLDAGAQHPRVLLTLTSQLSAVCAGRPGAWALALRLLPDFTGTAGQLYATVVGASTPAAR